MSWELVPLLLILQVKPSPLPRVLPSAASEQPVQKPAVGSVSVVEFAIIVAVVFFAVIFVNVERNHWDSLP